MDFVFDVPLELLEVYAEGIEHVDNSSFAGHGDDAERALVPFDSVPTVAMDSLDVVRYYCFALRPSVMFVVAYSQE